jgi:hypothetical protein
MIYQIRKIIVQQVLDMVQDTIFLREPEVRKLNNAQPNIASTPAPCQYSLKSEFNPVPGAKAFSFGIAREAYEKVYIKEQPPKDKSIPGPG